MTSNKRKKEILLTPLAEVTNTLNTLKFKKKKIR